MQNMSSKDYDISISFFEYYNKEIENITVIDPEMMTFCFNLLEKICNDKKSMLLYIEEDERKRQSTITLII